MNRDTMEFLHTRRSLEGNILSEISYCMYTEGNLYDVMQEFRRFLLAVSFQPGSIDEYIKAE
jgi:hypothetical protein